MYARKTRNKKCIVKDYFESFTDEYITYTEKDIKRQFLSENCIIPLWLKHIKNKRVLELGGNAGFFSKYLKQYSKIVSIDLSFPSLKHAKERYNLDTIQGDISQLPFQADSFDVIVSSGVIVYLNDASFKQLLEESKRILKEGGVILFIEPLEYVRWFRTYIKLFHLNFCETAISKIYNAIAKIRGYAVQQNLEKHPPLYIRNKESYVHWLCKYNFKEIEVRPAFVNLAPPRLEKYLFTVTFTIAPFITILCPSANNGLLICAKKI